MKTVTSVLLSDLRVDKTNVRHATEQKADRNFVASIEARGVEVPLTVRKNGKGYVVIDGSKRLAALQSLAKDGKIKTDAAVPVIVRDLTDTEARELSLTLNVIRLDMHPVDQYRAFAALHADKEHPLDVAAIASRFGIDTPNVEKMLALGALSEKVLTAWREDKMRADAAKAFTLLPDKKAQDALFDKLSKARELDAWRIKREVRKGQENVAGRLNAVGFEAYEQRGGKITRDLFGTDHVVSDVALLDTMLAEKIKATCDALIADGWSFAASDLPEDHHLYGQLQPFVPATLQKKLQALAQKVDNAADENDQEAHAKLEAEHDALESEIKRNAFTAAQKAKAGCFVGIGHNGDLSISYGRTKPKDAKEAKANAKAAQRVKEGKPAKSVPMLTNALRERLEETRLTAIRKALVLHPHHDMFAGMLAGIVAMQINPASRYNPAPDAIKTRLDTIANGIAPKVMNAELRKSFDAADYFEGAPKPFVLAAIAEAVSPDESRKLTNKKRAEIAKFATANVTKTGWLPKELRTAHYDGPGVKAKPATKAKKAKAKGKAKRGK